MDALRIDYTKTFSNPPEKTNEKEAVAILMRLPHLFFNSKGFSIIQNDGTVIAVMENLNRME